MKTAKVPTLTPGQVVEIFATPEAQMGPQGQAELVEFEMNTGDGLSRWRVHFLGDPPEATTSRIVYGQPKESES